MSDTVDPLLREHYCFGCDRHNPIGLHLAFEREGDHVIARYTPRPEDQGFPLAMHGGLAALLLDEAMGWAMYVDRIFAVTAKMETRFRRPVGLDAPLTVRGRILRRRGRSIEVEATLSDPDGERLAEAVGLLVRMPREQEEAALVTFGDGAQGR